MSLDMNLNRRIYISDSDSCNISVVRNGNSRVNSSKVLYVVEEFTSWRNLYEIHDWFVDNVKNGYDNDGDYYVSEHSFKSLANFCKDILDNRRGEFEGFVDGIENTLDICNEALKILETDKNCGFYYNSSC